MRSRIFNRMGGNKGGTEEAVARIAGQGAGDASAGASRVTGQGATGSTGGTTSKKVADAGNGGHYTSLTSAEGKLAQKQTNSFINAGGQGRYSQNANIAAENTTGKRAGDMMDWGMSNYKNAAQAEGRSALGLAGKHAVQGAGSGALVGGTIEASQGGSFWDGAKQGAFNGAVGMTAVRGAKRMSGADSYIGKGGIRQSGKNMWDSTNNSLEKSKPAVALLSQTQRDGMARSIMQQNSKKAKQV